MKLFLCSHFSSVGNLIKEEVENKKVVFVPTASIHEGYTGYVNSARKLFKKLGAILTEMDISKEEYLTIKSAFEEADVIYFTGGNSFFLIDQLRKTGIDELLKKEIMNGKLMSRLGQLYVLLQLHILNKWIRNQKIIHKKMIRDSVLLIIISSHIILPHHLRKLLKRY